MLAVSGASEAMGRVGMVFSMFSVVDGEWMVRGFVLYCEMEDEVS